MHIGQVSPDEQAENDRDVIAFLACIPRVEGWLNFLAVDRGDWSTGVFYHDGTPKPAAAVYESPPTCAIGE